MRVLDLFSGIGGFSLGLERAGMQTVAFCENEPFCQQVLKKHWPNVPLYSDIRELTSERLREDGITADLICGGFPCQDVSLAGKRKGLAGKRSGLWSEFARLIGEIRPSYAIVENTPGLLSLGMGVVLGDLAALRYDAEWHCIPAAAIGADHIRDRCWIITYPDEPRTVQTDQRRWQPCSPKMGKDATDNYSTRLQRGLQAKSLAQDARSLGPGLGFALCSAPAFPGLDGAGPPVMGRGEDGVPNRVHRMQVLGNAVVPQVVEVIGRAIMKADR